MTYEVFRNDNGTPRFITNSLTVARILAWAFRLDYAAQGEGWL